MTEIGEKLVALRTGKCMTQEDLAENLVKYVPEAAGQDVADSAVSQFLNQKFGDTADVLSNQWHDIHDEMIRIASVTIPSRFCTIGCMKLPILATGARRWEISLIPPTARSTLSRITSFRWRPPSLTGSAPDWIFSLCRHF